MRSVILALVFIASVYCADYYVQEGAASTGTGTTGSPFSNVTAAINAATNGDNIYLIPRLNGNAYSKCHDPMITKSLTIQSQTGGPAVVLDASFCSNYWFQATASVTLNFINLKLTAGAAFNLLGTATVVINNCDFLNQTSLFAAGTAKLSIIGSRIESNSYLDWSSSSSFSMTSSRIRNAGSPGPAISISTGNISFTSNIFIDNTPHISISGSSATVSLVSNSFSRSASLGAGNSISCGSTPTVTATTNTFCGVGTGTINTCGLSIATSTFVPRDGCGICNGNNGAKDCNGVCFGAGGNCRTPQTVNVTSFASLITAITNAGYGDTIVLAPGTYPVPSTQSISTLGKAITIRSQFPQESSRVIFTCADQPIFNFQNYESTDTVLQGFTLGGCTTRSSVKMTAEIGVQFKNLIFQDNYPTIDGDGGAVQVTNSWPSFINCAFVNSESSNSGGAIAIFGASYSVVSVSNSRFDNCRSYQGGAISITGFTKLTVTSSDFIRCLSADSPASNSIYSASGPTLVLSSSSFTGLNQTEVRCFVSLASGSGNKYCGTGLGIGCSPLTGTVNTSSDNCGVCGGNNAALDCNGTCFGQHVSGAASACCFPSQIDTCGVCYGLGDTCSCTPACQNGGICRGTCNCTAGWTGSDCSTSQCQLPCLNGGVCIGQNLCDCSSATLQGSRCDELVCGTHVCRNGASCNLGTCNCTSGYSGDNCTEFACTPSCENEGRCIGPNTCQCGGTFSGPTCSINTSTDGVVASSSIVLEEWMIAVIVVAAFLICVAIGVIIVVIVVRARKNRKGSSDVPMDGTNH